MKRNPEEELAKHLEGCFFWEKTTQYEECNNGDTAEIRRIQKKFRPKAKPKEMPKVQMPVVKRFDSSPKSIQNLTDIVSRFFDVPKDQILGSSRVKDVAFARKFLFWGICRYCPKASLARIGEVIGRHHSTVIHSRDSFEEESGKHEELIATFDKIMNYKPVW